MVKGRKSGRWNEEIVWAQSGGVVSVFSLLGDSFECFVRTNIIFVVKLTVGWCFVIYVKLFRGIQTDTIFVEIYNLHNILCCSIGLYF
jgi:hypothetical protein